MSLLSEWYHTNKLYLNVNKTVLVKFWSDGKNFEVNTNGVNIVNSSHTKFLGIMIDENLSWKIHVNVVMNRVKTNKQLLTKSKNLLNIESLKGVYHVLIYSHLPNLQFNSMGQYDQLSIKR